MGADRLRRNHLCINKKGMLMKIGMTLLAVWLILVGLVYALSLSFSGLSVVVGVLAIASGVCLLLNK